MSQTKAQLLDNIKDNVQLDARNSLRFADTDSSHYVAFKAPATVSSNVTWTLPAADGSANYVLATDGSGTLSWIADPAGQWVTSGSNIYFTGGNVGIGDSSPSNPLSVTGASAFNGDVTFTGASYNILWDKSINALKFADNSKLMIGAGDDFYITSGGTGVKLHANTGTFELEGDNVQIWNAAQNEAMAKFIADGAVELYHNSSKRIETTSYGLLSSNQVRINSSNSTTVGFSCGDEGTGFYNSGSNAIGYSANGTQKWNINSAGDLRLVDSVKATFGTGDDLLLYHDGTNSFLTNNTGDLYLRCVGSGDDIYIVSVDNISLSPGDENGVNVQHEGPVELYYNNNLRLSTTSAGVNIAGNLSSDSDTSFTVNAGGASGTAAHFIARCGSENAIVAVPNGAVELYHNNVLQLFTKSSGAEVTTTGAVANFVVRGKEGYGASITLASDDGDDPGDYARILQHTDEHLYFQVYNAANSAYEDAIIAKHDGAVELYHDNVKKAETASWGLNVLGNCGVGDGNKFQCGDSQDLQIYHDGSHNYIKCANGNLRIWSSASSEAIFCATDGGTLLAYGNSPKIETISTGINVTGGIRLGGNNAANEMDDYEEGSWTVTDDSGASLTFTAGHTARYIKVGNLVNIQFDITFPTTGSSAHPKFDNPFTGANNYGGGHVNWTNYAGGLVVHIGSNDMWLSKADDSDGSFSNSEMSGKRVIANVCYQIAS